MPKNNHISKIVLAVAFLSVTSIGFSRLAHAQTAYQQYQYQPLATVPGLTPAGGTTGQAAPINPATYIQNIYVFAFGLAVVIAIVSGVWSGVEWMMSGDSASKRSSAKERLINVGWGFALLLCSYLILSLINPQLVDFNLSLGTVGIQNLLTDMQAQPNSIATFQTSLASQQQQTQSAIQSAQSDATDAQNQLDNCAYEKAQNYSATTLADNGCDPASIATLKTQLATANANVSAYQAAATAQSGTAKILNDLSNQDIAQAQQDADIAAAASDAALAKAVNSGASAATIQTIQTQKTANDSLATITTDASGLMTEFTGSKSENIPASGCSEISVMDTITNINNETDTTYNKLSASDPAAATTYKQNAQSQLSAMKASISALPNGGTFLPNGNFVCK